MRPKPAFVIYALWHPTKREPFYIGQTQDAARRLQDHLDCRRRSTVGRTMTAIVEAGLVPWFQELDTAENLQQALQTEARETALHILAGFKLDIPPYERKAAFDLIQKDSPTLIQQAQARWPNRIIQPKGPHDDDA